MVVYPVFLTKAQEKQHGWVVRENKMKDFTPKKEVESKECK